ncbi:MAG: 16S rRNA (cytosine(967)-C(5))-methyltransferase RsmB [Thalassolituus sp.]
MTSPYGRARASDLSPRHAATIALYSVMAGQSLNQVIPALEDRVEPNEYSFFRDLAFGSCRWFFRLNAIAKMLLKNPFQEEDQDLHALLIIGLYQLLIQEKAPHAAVHATVDICDEMGKAYAKPVINACLRRYGREYEEILPPLDENPVTATSHPKWLVKMLTKAWPEHWQEILDSNNERGPLCLRVNARKLSREDYLVLLAEAEIDAHAGQISEDAVYLSQSCDVTALPGFDDGFFSVQDEAAQLAAQLLAPVAGGRVLDACSAPGGKTCHLLERNDIRLLAADADEERIERVNQNLQRLGLVADVVWADVSQPGDWWGDEQFDAILLDVPCSATGVIRRHPDIRMLRRREDIEQLVEVQRQILDNAWTLLKPGGRLLYATCSVLPQENSDQIVRFVDMHPDASLITLDNDWGMACNAGRQLFPARDGHDGFYYALLQKAD